MRAPRSIFAGAAAGTLLVHGLAAALLIALATPQSGAIEEAAISIFIDPGAAPVASATESTAAAEPAAEAQEEQRDAQPEQQSEARPEQKSESPPQPEPQAEPKRETAAPPAPTLETAIPLPESEEALAPPDFSRPPPPPPQPRAEPPKPKPAPTPPPQKAEPKRAPPPAAPRTAAPSPAPGAAPGPAAPSAPTTGSAAPGPPAAAPAPGWNALLAAWLAAHKRYPEDARRRSEEGEVAVRFTVAADGRVTDASVMKGSGFASLDASALGMLKGASLPAPGVEATRTVRIRFRLND